MFWSLFIFHGNSVREPASSRVTYFILQAFKGTKPIKEPVLAKPNIVTIYLLVIHSTLYTKGLFSLSNHNSDHIHRNTNPVKQ